MGKTSLVINSTRPMSNWQKAVQKTSKLLQNNLAARFVCPHLSPLIKDTLEITKPIKIYSPSEVADEMHKLQINKLRRLDSKTYSGETLEGKPDTIKRLKELGFETIVDFRKGYCSCYKKDCENNGIEYFNFPLSHTKNFANKLEVNDSFVKDLRKFFDICDSGNAYLACQWGIDRTNVGVILNYLLNPTEHLTPEVFAWGGDSAKSIINKNKKNAENILKQLTQEQKELLKIEPDCREILKRRTMKLINKNKTSF